MRSVSWRWRGRLPDSLRSHSKEEKVVNEQLNNSYMDTSTPETKVRWVLMWRKASILDLTPEFKGIHQPWAGQGQ